ncbi:pyridoxal-phosphate dependent enzyme [Ruegeria arenilitoris]|uniref:pyridoxal-phosphate dependent enzyme n=1 Tax=Ruegeria arenilitoris TaxID=1173585 RepID=UPI00147C0153|nr:pyridoxal-phosphate dependent enzyme [Ruegeria arenilitoris]
MRIIKNPHRAGNKLAPSAPYPSTDATRVADLLSLCPAAKETPLVDASDLAQVAHLWVKDERARMNLGSFKALGAAYVIARHAAEKSDEPGVDTLTGATYVTASAGNHGMSVAAGARIFGAKAVVFIAETVPESFAERLREQGASVVRSGADYAASMEAANNAADENGWTLLSDSSWEGYFEIPYTLMEGYLQMAAEAVAQCPETPTHIILQAGVGGLAGAVAAYSRTVWGDAPKIVVVEPEAAPALQSSIAASKCVFADGPDSIMGRLDCKEPSLIALNGLARDADLFLTLSDDEVSEQLGTLAALGLETTASGGAGVAAVMNDAARHSMEIEDHSRVLCFLSEVAE